MKKFRLIAVGVALIITLALCGCSFSVATAPAFSEIYKSQVITKNIEPNEDVNEKHITNLITNNAMSGVLTVYCENSSGGLGLVLNGLTVSQGSCGVFHYDGVYYYALTNSHVVNSPSGSSLRSIRVEDYKGNFYSAFIYQNPRKGEKAISADYDLAVICFKADAELYVFDFVNKNPGIGYEVILLGTPDGQKNAIYYGDVLEYIYPHFEDESEININFNVIKYSADTTNGSSGGPLLDGFLNIVGVHFGGSVNSTTHFAGAIPVVKVIEFLDKYCWIC